MPGQDGRSIAILPSSAPVRPASPPIPPTWRSRSLPRRGRRGPGPEAPAARGSTSSTGCPATTRPATPRCSHGELITADRTAAAVAALAGVRLSQGAGPGVLRLRRRRPSRQRIDRRRRRGARRAIGLRRGRAPALAGAHRRGALIRGGPATADAFAAAADDEFGGRRAAARQRIQGPAGPAISGSRMLSELASMDQTRCAALTTVGSARRRRSTDRDRRATTRTPLHRVEGREKVTGSARYAAEYPADDLRPRLAGARRPSPPAGSPTSTPPTVEKCPACCRCGGTATRRVLADVGMPMLAVLQSAEVHFRGRSSPLVVATSRRRSPGRPRDCCRSPTWNAITTSDLDRGNPGSADAGHGERRYPGLSEKGDPDSGFRREPGAVRCHLPHPGRAQQPDGTARHHRGLRRR